MIFYYLNIILVFLGGHHFTDSGEHHYNPQVTSYDYDAPISEVGDPTSKFFAIRETLAEVKKN